MGHLSGRLNNNCSFVTTEIEREDRPEVIRQVVKNDTEFISQVSSVLIATHVRLKVMVSVCLSFYSLGESSYSILQWDRAR